MIRWFVLVVLVVAATTLGKAQGFSFGDLFNQAGKQKSYYLQQIAAYYAFESELKQGYGVIKYGLKGIADINTAELNAHSTYYQSLAMPASAVKNSMQVQDIFSWQSSIISQFSRLAQVVGLTVDERSYISLVQSNLLKECTADMTDLQNLLQADTLQMTDDERLKRLSKLHGAMLDKYQFTQSYCSSVRLLAAERQQGINDTNTLNSLYEKN